MPKGELHNVFQRHGEPRIFVGHACQSQADSEATPWLAQAKGMADSAACMSDSGGGSTLSWETIEPGAHPSEHKFLKFLQVLIILCSTRPPALALASLEA